MTKNTVTEDGINIKASVEGDGAGATVNDVMAYKLKGGLYFVAIDTAEKQPVVNWFHGKGSAKQYEFIVVFRKRGKKPETFVKVKLESGAMERPKMLVHSTQHGCYFYIVPSVEEEKKKLLYTRPREKSS